MIEIVSEKQIELEAQKKKEEMIEKRKQQYECYLKTKRYNKEL